MVKNLLIQHGRYISLNKFEFQSSMKLLSRFLNKTAKDVINVGKRNDHLLTYLTVSKDLKTASGHSEGEENIEMNEDLEAEDIDIDEDDDDEEGWLGPNGNSVKAANGIVFSGPADSSDEEDEDELIEV